MKTVKTSSRAGRSRACRTPRSRRRSRRHAREAERKGDGEARRCDVCNPGLGRGGCYASDSAAPPAAVKVLVGWAARTRVRPGSSITSELRSNGAKVPASFPATSARREASSQPIGLPGRIPWMDGRLRRPSGASSGLVYRRPRCPLAQCDQMLVSRMSGGSRPGFRSHQRLNLDPPLPARETISFKRPTDHRSMFQELRVTPNPGQIVQLPRVYCSIRPRATPRAEEGHA
jgi:hypothetical protein